MGASFANSIARFALAKAKFSQASKRPRRNICLGCAWRLAVHGAIGVLKIELAGGVRRNEQVTTVTGAMVRAAERQQVIQLVVASIFPRAEMMHVDEGRMPATWHLATMPIAQQHRATNRRGNRLRSALRM